MARQHPYIKEYLEGAYRLQAKLFDGLFIIDSEVSEEDFINKFMRSRCKELLDHANPRLVNATVRELYEHYYRLGGEEPLRIKEDKQQGYAPQQLYWVGMMYEYAHWYYNIPSKELIEYIPLKDMLYAYRCGHQMGEREALEYIYKTWIKPNMDKSKNR